MNYRQGELIFKPFTVHTDKMPGKIKKDGIIREGETTGHMHQVIDGELYVDGAGRMYVKSEGAATLTHPEHKEIRFPKGTWEVIIQREYDDVSNRNVAD